MTYLTHFQCAVCGKTYALDEVMYTCPVCGEVGTLDMCYDMLRLRETITPAEISASTNFSLWRYSPLLPITKANYWPTLPVGWTPLIQVPRLAKLLGVGEVWLKDDGRNPTASLKDRASAMVVARAMEMGVSVVTTASTGNAAAALAGLCASTGLKAVIFVPAKAPPAKIAQLLTYGATVLLVQGSYDQAFDLCVQASQEYSWYCRNTGMNPYTTEGKKTASLEIAEQLGWEAPDALVVSVGDGSIISGQHRGWQNLYDLGWIKRLPRLLGVQAQGSSSLARAWTKRRSAIQMQPEPAETIADSISASLPRDRVKALRAVQQTSGAFVSVSDAEILAAIPELARASGVFAEPAAAATLAGARQAVRDGHLTSSDRIILLITGNGLKDIASATKAISEEHDGYPVETNFESVRRVVAELDLLD